LAGLGVDGGNLALAEGVVQRVGDGRHTDAQARGRIAVDHQVHLQAFVLQVAGDVGKLRQLAEGVHQLVTPQRQQLRVRGGHAELVLGAAHTVFDGQVLHRLHKQADTHQLVDFRLQTRDDLGCAQVALAVGLEVDQQASAVEGRVIAIHTDVGRQAFHRRIRQDDFGQRLLALTHGRKGNRLRRLGNTLDHPRVLHREKALGHHQVQHHGKTQRGDGHQQGQRLVLEHPLQLAPVGFDHPVDPGAAGLVEAALFCLFRLTLEQPRAHHRREGQGHYQGNQDRHRQGDGKFAEQASHHIGHEQQRNQHRDQRKGQGNQGETNLLGALEGGGQGGLAFFDVPGDVLQHHDGIVHHKPGGDGQGHQREVVDGEPSQVHNAESAHQRQRYGDGRNNRGADPAQEQEGHHHHQGNGDQQFMLYVLDRGADGLGAVGEDGDVEAGRQIVGDARQQRLDAVHHLNDVGTRLALDVQQHRLVFIGPSREALVFGAVDDLCHIFKAQRRAIVVGQDQFGVLLGRDQLVVGVEHRHPGRAVEVTLGLVDVGRRDQGAHIRQVQAISRQGFGVDLDTHGLTLATSDADHADATDLGNFLRHARVDQVIELGQQHGLGADSQGQHRGIRRVDLVVHRRRRQVLGQQIGGGVDRGLHLLLGDIHINVEVKTQGQYRSAAGTGGRHLGQAGHLPELALKGRGNRAGHHVGAGAGVEGHHPNGRVIHLGQGRDRQQAVRDDAGQDNGQHAQRGGDRAKDKQPRQVHAPTFCALPASAPVSPFAAGLPCRCSVGVVGTSVLSLTTSISLPSLRRSVPSSTTRSPATKPSLITVFSPSVSPTTRGCTLTFLSPSSL